MDVVTGNFWLNISNVVELLYKTSNERRKVENMIKCSSFYNLQELYKALLFEPIDKIKEIVSKKFKLGKRKIKVFIRDNYNISLILQYPLNEMLISLDYRR